MMPFSVSNVLFAGAVLLADSVSALSRDLSRLVPPPVGIDSALEKRAVQTGVFKQLIDHSDPDLGTFDQRVWYTDEWYAGPGSPVVFFTPGEIAADGYLGYLTNATITGLYAAELGAAIVMMEHRYWGTSSPHEKLTVKNMQQLTLENSIHDTTYLANNIELPFDADNSTKAANAPWIFVGGSYSGALAAWVESVDPGTFYAYHASSAVVEAIDDFWQYFHPVQQGMPKNCSADLELVIEHVDTVLKTGTDEQKLQLKRKFGLEGIEHDDDFAGALENGPWNWQGHDFSSGYSDFFQFCDYVENAIPEVFNCTAVPGEKGVGLRKALNGYATWTKTVMLPGFCAGYKYWTDDYDLGCFDTYNASNPFFTDISLDNDIDRQWNWMLCNEPFKYWQDGAPEGVPTIVSRLVTNRYWERQCDLFFPAEGAFTYGIRKGRNVTDVNRYTGGWAHADGPTRRVLWVNGEWDPWRDATVSSEFRPGGPLESTPGAPNLLIPGGIHCSDLRLRNAEANDGVRQVVDLAVGIIKGWVGEYYDGKVG